MANHTMGNSSSYSGVSDDSTSSSSSGSGPEHSDSPMRSPDTTTLEDFAGTSSGHGAPYLKIIEEPSEKSRFRYKTEMQGTHGAILGVNTDQKKKIKTFPAVQICNYNNNLSQKKTIIRCTMCTAHRDVQKRVRHAHQLRGKKFNQDNRATGEEQDDPHDIAVTGPSYQAVFQQMTILCTKKEDQVNYLVEKKQKHATDMFVVRPNRTPSEQQLNKWQLEAQTELAGMDLNVVCLKFEAFYEKNGMYTAICPPVYSRPISNMKNPKTNELRICRVDKVSGSCAGKDEVFILVEKLNKDNVKVIFFEEDDHGNVVWSDEAEFRPEDVHHQYAIVFRTPPFKDPKLKQNVLVKFHLMRISDGEASEPREFEYYPDPNNRDFNRKRPRIDTYVPTTIENRFQQVTISSNNLTNSRVPSPLPDFGVDFLDDFSFPENIVSQVMEGITPGTNEYDQPKLNTEMTDSIPSADSDIIRSFMNGIGRDQWREYVQLQGEDAESADLLFNQVSSTNNVYECGLVLDGPSKPPSRDWDWTITTGPVTKLPDHSKRYLDCSINQVVFPESADHQMAYTVVEPQGLSYNKPISETFPVVEHNGVIDEPIRSGLRHQMADNVHVATHQMAGPTVIKPTHAIHQTAEAINVKPSQKSNDSGNISPTERLRMKASGFVELTKKGPQECSSLGYIQAGPAVVVRQRVSVTEENIVMITENTADIFLKLLRSSKISETKFKMCLTKLFSYTVGPDYDTVFHILAAHGKCEFFCEAKKFSNILKSYNVHDAVINQKNERKESPLHIAVVRGSEKMVSLLLDTGADINLKDAEGNTPMHLAVKREINNLDIVVALLERLPNLMVINNNGYTAFHLAVIENKMNAFVLFLTKIENKKNLSEFINIPDRKCGHTALHLAIIHRYIPFILCLLQMDTVDFNIKNYAGQSPLDLVWSESDPQAIEIKRMLLSKKDDCSEHPDQETVSDEELKDVDIEDVDVEVKIEVEEEEEAVTCYADEWEFDLFDQITISRLCAILDQDNRWRLLSIRLKFTENEINHCKKHWSPSLFMFIHAARYKPCLTAEAIRDHLLNIGDNMETAVQVIDDMLLKKLDA